MALAEVKKIIIRAAIDPDYRVLLFNQPDLVLSRYELTEEEKQSLKELDEEKLSKAIKIESSTGIAYSNDIRI